MERSGLEQLRQECTSFFCERLGAVPLVFGDGLAKGPRLMLVGEAPGAQEALEGKPFVGKAGKNLDAFLERLSLSRDEIYISNVVKIRPTKASATGRLSNRPPSREEIALFLPWLLREVALVQPRALVTLGNVALRAFLSEGVTIGGCHGKWHQAQVEASGAGALSLPLFALYHPASVIYRAELKETYQQDLDTLRDSLPCACGRKA